MRDSWIDRDELDELVGSFAAPRKGKGRRVASRPKGPKAPGSQSVAQPQNQEAPDPVPVGLVIEAGHESIPATIFEEASEEVVLVAGSEDGHCGASHPAGSDGRLPVITDIFELDDDPEEEDLIEFRMDEEDLNQVVAETDGMVIEDSQSSAEVQAEIVIAEIFIPDFEAEDSEFIGDSRRDGEEACDFREPREEMSPPLLAGEAIVPTAVGAVVPLILPESADVRGESGHTTQESAAEGDRVGEEVSDRPEPRHEMPPPLPDATELLPAFPEAISSAGEDSFTRSALDAPIPRHGEDVVGEKGGALAEEGERSEDSSSLIDGISDRSPEAERGAFLMPELDLPGEEAAVVSEMPEIPVAELAMEDDGLPEDPTESEGVANDDSSRLSDATPAPSPEAEGVPFGLPEVDLPVEEVLVVSTSSVEEPFREIPQFLDDADDFVPRMPSLLERDADRALIALAEARARAERGGLLRGSRHAETGLSALAAEVEEGGGLPLQQELFSPDEDASVILESDPMSGEELADEEGLAFDEVEGLDDEIETIGTRGSLSDRVANFVILACAELGASAGAVSDRDGFLLYAHSDLEDDDELQTALLLEVAGQTDRLLGVERGRATQVSTGGGTWRCLIRGGDPTGGLYAGFQLSRPLDQEEIERWRISLGDALSPIPEEW